MIITHLGEGIDQVYLISSLHALVFTALHRIFAFLPILLQHAVKQEQEKERESQVTWPAASAPVTASPLRKAQRRSTASFRKSNLGSTVETDLSNSALVARYRIMGNEEFVLVDLWFATPQMLASPS